MPTLEELIRAAQVLQQPQEPVGPLVGLPPPGPLPLTPEQEFWRAVAANTTGGILGTLPGLASLMTGGNIPIIETAKRAAHEAPKRWFGVPETPTHPTASFLGGLLGDILGLVPGAVGGAGVGRFILRSSPKYAELAVKSPLLARSIQSMAEAVGAEAATANPSWTGIVGFGVLDIGLRSKRVSEFIDRMFPRLRSKKLPVWDIDRMSWMRVSDFLKADTDPASIFKALNMLAGEMKTTPGTVASLLTRPALQDAWKSVFDPANVTVTEAAKTGTVILASGRSFVLNSPDAILDATRAILDGDNIQRLVTTPKHFKLLKQEVLAQTSQEIQALLRTEQHIAGKTRDEILTEFKNTYANAPDVAKLLKKVKDENYALIRKTSRTDPLSAEFHLVPLNATTLDQLRRGINTGQVSIMDFLLLGPGGKVTGSAEEATLNALFPKRFPWETVHTGTTLPWESPQVIVQYTDIPVKTGPFEKGDDILVAGSEGTFIVGDVYTLGGQEVVSVLEIGTDGTVRVVAKDVPTTQITHAPQPPVHAEVSFSLAPDGTPPPELESFIERTPGARVVGVLLRDPSDAVVSHTAHSAVKRVNAKTASPPPTKSEGTQSATGKASKVEAPSRTEPEVSVAKPAETEAVAVEVTAPPQTPMEVLEEQRNITAEKAAAEEEAVTRAAPDAPPPTAEVADMTLPELPEDLRSLHKYLKLGERRIRVTFTDDVQHAIFVVQNTADVNHPKLIRLSEWLRDKAFIVEKGKKVKLDVVRIAAINAGLLKRLKSALRKAPPDVVEVRFEGKTIRLLRADEVTEAIKTSEEDLAARSGKAIPPEGGAPAVEKVSKETQRRAEGVKPAAAKKPGKKHTKEKPATYPTAMTAEQHRILRNALRGRPESNAPFVTNHLATIKRIFGIDAVIMAGRQRGQFLEQLEDGLRDGLITPLDYTLSAIMVRSLPDELFDATKLSLRFVTDAETPMHGVAELSYNAQENLSTILLMPGATHEVIAHELAEQALRLLKEDQAIQLAKVLINDVDMLTEQRVLSIAATQALQTGEGVSNPIDVAAKLLSEYMIERFVRKTVPESAYRVLENRSPWQKFRTLMKAVWTAVRAVLRMRGDDYADVHAVFDKIFTPAESGGWMSATASFREAMEPAKWDTLFSKLRVVAGETTVGKDVLKAVAKDIKRFVQHEYGDHFGKLIYQSPDGPLIINMSRRNAEAGAIVVDRLGKAIKKALGVEDLETVGLTNLKPQDYADLPSLYGADAVPAESQILSSYKPFVAVGDEKIPLGVVIFRIKTGKDKSEVRVFFTKEFLDHVIGFANPNLAKIDQSAWDRFIRNAQSRLETQLRAELADEVVHDERKVITGIRRRLAYNLGLSSFDIAQLNLKPSYDGRYQVTLDGPSLPKVARALADRGWTVDDLLVGFRMHETAEDGSSVTTLAVDRWVRAALNSTASKPTSVKSVTEENVLSVRLNPGLKPGHAVVRYTGGITQSVNIANLRKLALGSETSGTILGIEASDPDTAAFLLSRSTIGDEAPVLVISDKEFHGDTITWYLRRQGRPLSKDLDEVVVTNEIVVEAPAKGEEMGLHKFGSRELQLALSAGYKIQAVYGRFEGVSVTNIVTDIRRGLTNTPLIPTNGMIFDPAGLRYLVELADDRGFHLLPDISAGRIKLITHDTQTVHYVHSGEEAVEFLLDQPRVSSNVVDPATESMLLRLAKEIKLKVPEAKEQAPNFAENGPMRGFTERALAIGKAGLERALQWFHGQLAPTRDAAPIIERWSKGRYKLQADYQKAKEVHNELIKATYEGYKALVGDTLDGMTDEELRQINLALAYYVGAPESLLRKDPGAAAFRASFLNTVKLSERQMAAIKRIAQKFTDEYKRIELAFTIDGREMPTHIFGYARRQVEGLPLPFDDIMGDTGYGVTAIPGQFKERVIPGIVESKHTLPVNVMIMRYIFSSRYYEIVRPHVVEMESKLKAIYELKNKTVVDTLAAVWYRHLTNQLAARRGAPPNILISAVTDIVQNVFGKDSTTDAIINDLITYVYASSLGFRLSAAIRNRTHPILLLFPFAGREHTKRGIMMAREYLKNPSGDLSRYIDTTFATWTPEAIEQAKFVHNMLRNRADSIAVKWAELGLILMQKTETRNKAESFFTGVSIAEEVLARLRRGERVKDVIESTPLQAMEPAVRTYLLRHASLALRDASHIPAFYKRFGEQVVAHTAWLYGPMEMPGWTRSRLARLMLMYMTWPLNYIHYVLRGLRNIRNGKGDITPYGKAFLARFIGINVAGISAFTALGINNDNMFFLGPAEYTGGPFMQLTLDALDAARLSGDLRRPAIDRLQIQALRTLMPAGSGIHELIRIGKSIGAAAEGEAPFYEAPKWFLGTPSRIVEEREASRRGE